MSSAHPPQRVAITVAGLLVLLGLILFSIGMIAGLRAPGPARDATVLGFAAWQFAVAGFICTLAGGLWLRRLIQ